MISDLSPFIVMVGGTVAIVFATALVFRAFNSARTRTFPDVKVPYNPTGEAVAPRQNRTSVTEDDTGLKVLYDPMGEAPPEIDIVAVHGIGAHPDHTWSRNINPKGREKLYVNWLKDKDMLPAAVPNARIMRFGYQSAWFEKDVIRTDVVTVAKNLLALLSDKRKDPSCQKRPLLFVAHCFGGLVVLRALQEASEDDTMHCPIHDDVIGITFFGTPFRGSEQVGLTSLIQAAHIAYGDAVQDLVLRTTHPYDTTLRLIVEHFQKRRNRLKWPQIACFYEQKWSDLNKILEHDGPKTYRVDINSGCLDAPEHKYGLERTHFSMNKFRRPDEPDYVIVRQAIERMVKAGLARSPLSPSASDEYRIPVQLPYRKNPYFKGREEQVSSLFLAEDATKQRLNRQVMAVCGLSGTGKSQIALEYAYRYAEKYSAIFWINTKNESEMDASTRKAVKSIIHHRSREPSTETYRRIAWSLGLDVFGITSGDSLLKTVDESSCAQCLRNWLGQDCNNKWLLVLDNYDDPANCDLEELLPNRDVGHVLITSCIPNPYNGCKIIGVPAGIEQDDAVNLLVLTMGSDIAPDEIQGAVDIVETVGRLPFAVTLIGAFLRKSPMPLDMYAQNLKTNLKEPLEPLNTVWQMSLQKLTAHAKHLLWLFSLMGNEDIPKELLLGGMGIIDWMASDLVIFKALGELTSLSLVGRKQDKSLYIHQLLHNWTRDHIENAKLENSKLVIDIIRSTLAFGDMRGADKCAYERRILPHIDRCFELFDAQLPSDDRRLDCWNQKAAYDLARVYTGLGYVQKSSRIYERSLMGISYPIHPIELEMMDSFGVILRLQGKYHEALTWCRLAQDGIESQLGKESFKALAVALNVAFIYKELGKYPEAIAQYKEVLRRQGHSSTLETKYQLACVLRDSGEYSEALVQLEQVYEDRKKNLGGDHPNTLNALHAIATVLEKQGIYEEALKHHFLVLEEQKKSLGDGHYSTLDTIESVASIQERLGQYDDALASYRGVLKGLEVIFGEGKDNPWIAGVQTGIADILLRQAKYDEAETTYTKAHASFKRLHNEVRGEFPTATNIARVLRDKGQYQDALKWCETAREGLKELGENGEHMLALKVCTAHIVELQGMYGEALQMSQQICEAFGKKYGEDHAETLKTRCRLGSVFNCQGRYKEALEQFKKAQSGLTEAIGSDHHQTLVAVQGQADVLQQQGEYDQVLQLCDDIQKRLGGTLGEKHPQTLMAVYRSGSALVSKGENETGLKVIQRAMDGWKTVLGENHPYISMCLEDIGNAFKGQGESDQAIDYYKKAIEGYRLKLGDGHPWVYRAQVNLAGVLSARDPAQHDEVERLYSAAIIGLEKTLGIAHPWTITATDDKNKAFPQSKV